MTDDKPSKNKYINKAWLRKPWKAIILDKKENEAKLKLTIDNNDTESTKSLKLLGITTDDHLQFDQHI